MKGSTRTGIAASIGILFLILDTKTAISGAQEGIRLCLMTAIPALLPFIFLSMLLTSALTGTELRFLRGLGKFIRLPAGSESIVLIGALGGYPTGAQAVASAYEQGQLSKTDAQRMLGFCSNAGPSFLFGIAASCFSDRLAPWILWLIHLFSAIMVGFLLPGGSRDRTVLKGAKPITPAQALIRSVCVMAQICGWIVVFRVLLGFCNRWFLWFAGSDLQIFINGLLELTIGCTALSRISCTGLRFIFCSAFLGFGGLCVAMQTASVTASIGLGLYIPGKILQCLISVFCTCLIQNLMFTPEERLVIPPFIYAILVVFAVIIVSLLRKSEKRCRFPTAVGV